MELVQSFWLRLEVGYKLFGTVALFSAFSAVILSVLTITSTVFKRHRPAMELAEASVARWKRPVLPRPAMCLLAPVM